MGEYDRLSYGKALLALFLSSVLQTVLFVVASVLLDVGIFAVWILGIFVGAVLLRVCLGPFGWTISIKAAALTRLVCGFISGVVVGFAAVALAGSPDGSSSADPALAMGPGVFIVAGILELVTSAGVIPFFATRLEEIDSKPEWTPRSDQPDARGGGGTVYSAEDFLADSVRGRR